MRTPADDGEAEEGTRLTADQILENVLRPAEQELRRPAGTLLWSASASGLVIGFSCLASAFAAHAAPDAYAHAAASAAYPLGFIFVIMARSELFTENTLSPIIPLLERRDRETFGRVLRIWGLLLAGNLGGTLIVGLVLARTAVLRPAGSPAAPAAYDPCAHLILRRRRGRGGARSDPGEYGGRSDAGRGRDPRARMRVVPCHSGVTRARGLVGPPLTDLARRSYIAGHLFNSPVNLVAWIRYPDSLRPGTAMPTLGVSEQEARDITAYLYLETSAGGLGSPHLLPASLLEFE